MKQEEVYFRYKKSSGIFKMEKEERDRIEQTRREKKLNKKNNKQRRTLIEFGTLLKNKHDLKTLIYEDTLTNSIVDGLIE